VKRIYYRRLRRYKYILLQPHITPTPIRPAETIDTPLVSLSAEGVLAIEKGYAWDGPSGPSVDTDSFMRGSLVHDALYQLMRTGRLAMALRPAADKLLKDICLEDGMSRFRAWFVYRAVRMGGSKSARPRPEDDVRIA
jgi:hypothetical protein